MKATHPIGIGMVCFCNSKIYGKERMKIKKSPVFPEKRHVMLY
jgi:hypothetical protein